MPSKGSGPKEPPKIEIVGDESTHNSREPGSPRGVENEPLYDLSDDALSHEIRLDSSEPHLEKQINSLKDQVSDISNTQASLTSDQTEILKRYITLKETEVRDLRDQNRQHKEYLQKLTLDLRNQTLRNHDLATNLEAIRKKEEAVRAEFQLLKSQSQEEINRLKSDYEEKLRKSGNYESQVEELFHKREEWREKIKEDLKRLKLKERELENKHELFKRDMQALLDSKDKHVLELKKKTDAFELEMESLEERLRKANMVLGSISSKKRRLTETMRLAISLLESLDEQELKDFDSDPQKKTG